MGHRAPESVIHFSCPLPSPRLILFLSFRPKPPTNSFSVHPPDSTRLVPLCSFPLQAEWSYPVDLWSVGVVLLEMLAGRQLFALSHDDVHLHMMEKLLGKKVGLLVLGFRVRGSGLWLRCK
jgi:hypothetical protein